MNIFPWIKFEMTQNLKNITGWKTKRKIVVISVDDYGNVRLNSKKSREALDRAGLKVLSRFDVYDSLENEEDLLGLYDVLSSVKDKNGNHPVFTAFATPANIDFEKMKETSFNEYYYELLPETFNKLAGYENVYGLWKEGIKEKLIIPQFHGREHLNIKMLMHLLKAGDKEVLACFDNRSYTSISSRPFPTINFTAALDFFNFKENTQFDFIIEDGLNAFEKVFGFRARHFNPSGGREHSILHKTLHNNGVYFIDAQRFHKEHQGSGKYHRKFYYTGMKNSLGQIFMVRNCVFEPTHDRGVDWVQFCLKQIDVAFRWNNPANISSHRVNYCGHISSENRKIGLGSLRILLKEIAIKWPDVEFMSSVDLMDLINLS